MKVLFTLFCGFFVLNLVAQKNNKTIQNSFQVAVGLNQLKDKNLHPKVHTGALYSLQYSHNRTQKNLSTIHLQFSYAKTKTALEQVSSATNIQLNGGYGYLFHIKDNDKLSYFLGPKFLFNYRLNHYPMWDDSHLYWANDFSLACSNKLQYSFTNNTRVVCSLDLSILSLFSRPILNRAYKIDDVSLGGILKNMHSNFNLGTVNKAFNFRLGGEYQFQCTPKIIQAISYTFSYHRFHAKNGLSFSNLQHNLGLKLYF